MEPVDHVLWSRSRSGDADAFGQLFDRHSRTIYNYLFRRTGDWSAAEDMLSVVFLEAWRRRTKDLPDDKVLPWLFGIATNVLRNKHRADRRYRAALARYSPPGPTPDFSDESQSRLAAQQEAKQALHVLAKLPARERDVFVLCEWSDLSYEEAALALGVPIGTVRSRLSRARVRLREPNRASGHEQGRPTTSTEVTDQ